MTPEDTADMMITVADVRMANMCAPGFIQWFKDVGLESRFREFIKTGLPADVILATGDGYGQKVVELKLARGGVGNG